MLATKNSHTKRLPEYNAIRSSTIFYNICEGEYKKRKNETKKAIII